MGMFTETCLQCFLPKNAVTPPLWQCVGPTGRARSVQLNFFSFWGILHNYFSVNCLFVCAFSNLQILINESCGHLYSLLPPSFNLSFFMMSKNILSVTYSFIISLDPLKDFPKTLLCFFFLLISFGLLPTLPLWGNDAYNMAKSSPAGAILAKGAALSTPWFILSALHWWQVDF